MTKFDSWPVPVTLLLQDLELHGTQRQMLELAARLDRTRFLPKIVTLCGGNMPFSERAAHMGLECISLTDSPVCRPAQALPALWKFLKKESPPILQCLTSLPNIWGRIMGKMRGLPNIIACCRNTLAVKWQHERFLKNLADIHICNSQLIHDKLVELAGIPATRIRIIPNGVDTDFFIPAEKPTETPNIVCIGRMVSQKNHALLLRAFARVLTQSPKAVLHLVGEGPLRPIIEKQANAPELHGHVVFHPPNPDLRYILHQTQLFVLPSDYEGMPNVILEAMACGLPVVATNIGGSSELVDHGKTGLLTPQGDADSLADTILFLLTNKEVRLEFGRLGRERSVEKYSMQSMVEGHESVYESLFTQTRAFSL